MWINWLFKIRRREKIRYRIRNGYYFRWKIKWKRNTFKNLKCKRKHSWILPNEWFKCQNDLKNWICTIRSISWEKFFNNYITLGSFPRSLIIFWSQKTLLRRNMWILTIKRINILWYPLKYISSSSRYQQKTFNK